MAGLGEGRRREGERLTRDLQEEAAGARSSAWPDPGVPVSLSFPPGNKLPLISRGARKHLLPQPTHDSSPQEITNTISFGSPLKPKASVLDRVDDLFSQSL